MAVPPGAPGGTAGHGELDIAEPVVAIRAAAGGQRVGDQHDPVTSSVEGQPDRLGRKVAWISEESRGRVREPLAGW
ncbi:hypothetical protein ACWED2_12500 [Amycolatopsis sp. NPDC005003]